MGLFSTYPVTYWDYPEKYFGIISAIEIGIYVSTNGKMVVWGPVVWIYGISLWKGFLLRGTRFESQTTNPNHQFTIWVDYWAPFPHRMHKTRAPISFEWSYNNPYKWPEINGLFHPIYRGYNMLFHPMCNWFDGPPNAGRGWETNQNLWKRWSHTGKGGEYMSLGKQPFFCG